MLVNMFDAKTQLSKLVEAAMRGEEVVIANRGKPMVRLLKVEAPTAKRAWGVWKGKLTKAEIDYAFSPQVEAEAAAEFMASADRIDPLFEAAPRKKAAPKARKPPGK